MAQLPPDLGGYKGKPLRAFLADLLDYIYSNRIRFSGGSGLVAEHTKAGVFARLDMAAPMILVKTPVGGIAAGGNGACELYDYTDDGLSLLTGQTVSVFNPYSTGVGGSKKAWAAKWKGRYMIVTEQC